MIHAVLCLMDADYRQERGVARRIPRGGGALDCQLRLDSFRSFGSGVSSRRGLPPMVATHPNETHGTYITAMSCIHEP